MAANTNRPARPRRKAPRTARVNSSAVRHSIPIRSSGAITRALKTSEAVARDVVRDILAAELKPGDSLPAEAAMLEQYKVSRESLREGLRLLEVEGLITIRRGPGGGPLVGTVDPAAFGRVASLYYQLAGATYRELFEAWVLAESILAERAARNPDTALRKATMEPFISSHADDTRLDDFVEEHTDFHAAVGALARNRVLQLSLLSMGLIVTHHVLSAYDTRTIGDRLEEDHHELAASIAAGRAAKSHALMRDHTQWIADLSSEILGAAVDDIIEWH